MGRVYSGERGIKANFLAVFFACASGNRTSDARKTSLERGSPRAGKLARLQQKASMRARVHRIPLVLVAFVLIAFSTSARAEVHAYGASGSRATSAPGESELAADPCAVFRRPAGKPIAAPITRPAVPTPPS